jgi:glycosyltransferase involved in cell wall biosynthesis
MAAYLPAIRHKRLPVVFDWHNIESEAMRRYSASARSALRRAYAAFTARRLAALEKRILREGLGHIVCSERERDALKRVAPDARVAVVENGVDARAFAAFEPAATRDRLVFVGSMDYHANVDAAVWFVRNVWPGLHEIFPMLRLTLVGSNPVEAVLALRSEPGVEVSGTVDDVRPYYAEALAAIVPLRLGGGTRLKILEAMAAGAPVISTPLGAEGLAVTPGVNILLAKQDRDWESHIRAVIENQDLRMGMARAARELACSRYDWEAIGASLHSTYCEWLGATK